MEILPSLSHSRRGLEAPKEADQVGDGYVTESPRATSYNNNQRSRQTYSTTTARPKLLLDLLFLSSQSTSPHSPQRLHEHTRVSISRSPLHLGIQTLLSRSSGSTGIVQNLLNTARRPPKWPSHVAESSSITGMGAVQVRTGEGVASQTSARPHQNLVPL